MLPSNRMDVDVRRRRTASAAGLAQVARYYGRNVARRIVDAGQPALASVVGSAVGAAGLAAGVAAAGRRSLSASARKGMLLAGSMGGAIHNGKVKKKKSTKKKKSVLSKAAKKDVVRIVKRMPKKEFLGQLQSNYCGQLTADVNKVSWTKLEGNTSAQWLEFCNTQVIATTAIGNTNVWAQQPSDLSALVAGNKVYRIVRKSKFVFKNNTNAPLEIVLYRFKATDNTSNSPAQDLDARVTAGYFTTASFSSIATAVSAPMAKEDNFQLYWSTRNSGKSQWKMLSKVVVSMAAGDEYHYFATSGAVVNAKEAGSFSYHKGNTMVYARLMGRPSHDTATQANVGISKCRLDYLETYVTTSYSTLSPTVVSNFALQANAGFSSITPVVAGDANVADVNDG